MLKNKLDLNTIKILEIELTTLCNLSCPLCYRNNQNFKKRYPKNLIIDLDIIKNRINLFPNLTEILLVGSISEPTLYPYFFELIDFINIKNIKIEICTNGDNHNKEWWKILASKLKNNDQVYFTICGSTQELHSTYRVGSNLQYILDNAEAFRNERKKNNLSNIDYAQCIKFKYNEEDFNSFNFKNLISDFSNIYWTETFLNNTTNSKFDPNLKKKKLYNYSIQFAEKKFIKNFKKSKTVSCKSENMKSVFMDIYGKIFPCYYFLENSIDLEWNEDYDIIKDFNYECCKYCEVDVNKMCEKLNTVYIM